MHSVHAYLGIMWPWSFVQIYVCFTCLGEKIDFCQLIFSCMWLRSVVTCMCAWACIFMYEYQYLHMYINACVCSCIPEHKCAHINHVKDLRQVGKDYAANHVQTGSCRQMIFKYRNVWNRMDTTFQTQGWTALFFSETTKLAKSYSHSSSRSLFLKSKLKYWFISSISHAKCATCVMYTTCHQIGHI